MFQGISFWARMVRSSAAVPLALFAGACAVHEPPAWSPLAGWRQGSPILVAPGTTSSTQVTAHEPDGTAESTFSSYRSSSGHAVAQVIVPAG